MNKLVCGILTVILCLSAVGALAQESDLPEVRWTYPVSLTEIQSKYAMLVNVDNMLEKDYNIILTNATEHISAISADFTESQILRIPLNSPLLLVRRISCTEQGPIEYASIKIVADKYEYSVYLEGRK